MVVTSCSTAPTRTVYNVPRGSEVTLETAKNMAKQAFLMGCIRHINAAKAKKFPICREDAAAYVQKHIIEIIEMRSGK